MMTFLVQMIPQVEVEVKPDYEQQANPSRGDALHVNILPRTVSLDSRDSFSDDTSMEDLSRSGYHDEFSSSRKRPYYASIYEDEPASVRRRIDKLEISDTNAPGVFPVSRPVSTTDPAVATSNTRKDEPPLFVVDQVGDTKPRTTGPPAALTEAEKLRTMLDSYHEIVKAMFTARTKLVERITSINWDNGGANYSQKLSVRNCIFTALCDVIFRIDPYFLNAFSSIAIFQSNHATTRTCAKSKHREISFLLQGQIGCSILRRIWQSMKRSGSSIAYTLSGARLWRHTKQDELSRQQH